MGDRDDDVFFRNQILETDLGFFVDDFGSAGIPVLLLHLAQFLDDDFAQLHVACQDFFQIRNFLPQLFQLVFDLLPLERRQPLELHLENRLRLDLGELVLRDQALAGFDGCLGRSNQRDDGIDVIERFLEAFQDVRARFRLTQFVLRTTAHHVNAVFDERPQQFEERQDPGLPIDDREIDDAKRRLHWRQLVQIVQDDQTLLAALQLDDDAHALTIALIANVADAFEAFLIDQLRDLFNQAGFIDLIRNFGHDNDVAVFALPFDRRAGAHRNGPAARLVRLINPTTPMDDAGGRKIRARYVRNELGQLGLRVVDQMNDGLTDLIEVVWRHIRGHAHGNAIRSIDQEIGHLARQI